MLKKSKLFFFFFLIIFLNFNVMAITWSGGSGGGSNGNLTAEVDPYCFHLDGSQGDITDGAGTTIINENLEVNGQFFLSDIELEINAVPWVQSDGTLEADDELIAIDPNNFYFGIQEATPNYPLHVMSQNGSDVTAFFEKNITATGFITQTEIYDNSKGDVFNYIEDDSNKLTNGKIDHRKFYGYVEWNENGTTKSGVRLDSEIAMLRQAVYELEQRIEELEARK